MANTGRQQSDRVLEDPSANGKRPTSVVAHPVSSVSSADLQSSIAAARARPRMTAREREEQTRNFAAGNVGLENERVTRAVVDEAAARRHTNRAR